MNTELIIGICIVSFSLGVVIYRWYQKVTAPESDDGEKITIAEVFDLLEDQDFQQLVEEFIDNIKKAREKDAVPE